MKKIKQFYVNGKGFVAIEPSLCNDLDTLVNTAKTAYEEIKDYNGFDEDGYILRQPLRNLLDTFHEVQKHYSETNPEDKSNLSLSLKYLINQLTIAFQYLTSAAVFAEDNEEYRVDIAIAKDSIRFARNEIEYLSELNKED